MPNIVTLVVSQQVAPTPSDLQKKGCFISWGGTNTAPGTQTLLTLSSSLTPFLNTAKANTTLAWSGGVVTVTTTAPHGMVTGDVIPVVISGATPAGYNVSANATITGASTFTYPLASNPGSATIYGAWATQSLAELTAMNTTFWAQGSFRAVTVLELGPLGPTRAVAALSAFMTAQPNAFYNYLVPRCWDANAAFLSLVAAYESPSAKQYFTVTTSLATWSNYTSAMKCVFGMIEAPAYGQWSANALTAITYSTGVVTATTTTAHGVAVGQWFQVSGCLPVGYNGWWQAQIGTTGSTLVYNVPAAIGVQTSLGTLVASYAASAGTPASEFSAAAAFWRMIAYDPNDSNRMTTLNYAYLYGVTPFPIFGNSALLTTLKAGNVNVISTGAEGGISNTILTWGATFDGNKFNYWYSTDWMQINLDLSLANAIINGSNNPINPLYYNQLGINTLLNAIAAVVNNGVSFGLVLFQAQETGLDGPALGQGLSNGNFIGSSVCNAIPFITYSLANPGDYALGRYNGFSVIFTPQNGFDTIQINLVVTSFVSNV